MYLKCSTRRKDGKEHRTWSIVESCRIGRRCVQRHVLYLGEINDSQRVAWQKSIEVFEEGQSRPVQMAIFPEDRQPEESRWPLIQVKLDGMELHRPRQWGACWMGLELWRLLRLDEFWGQRLEASREGTQWDLVLSALVLYRLIDPGSEWRLHRHWYDQSALGDLLGQDRRLVGDDTLYRCLDKLVEHKVDLFVFLKERWKDLFNPRFDVLLYDLTSTYFECNPPEQDGLRRYGYSRDKRSDCVQVVIALIVTPEGFPLGYEVMNGNTADCTTLASMLEKIESQHGKADRTWLMDRGIPTEKTLEKMRETGVKYLVGTPKGRLSKLEAALAETEWQQAREGVEVKLHEQEGEIYVLAKSEKRVGKERSMRRKRLKTLWKKLGEFQKQKLTYNNLLMKLGAAKSKAGKAWHLVKVELPDPPKGKGSRKKTVDFTFSLNKDRLRQTLKREGRYLLRTNLRGEDPAQLWEHYMTLTQVEEAFKNLKGDLAVRPIHHQKDERIEAHIFVSFLAYCLHVTLGRRLRDLAPGLTPRAVLEKFARMSMIDVHLPTTDGRKLILCRHTHPDEDCRLLLDRLKMTLPPQPPPKISSDAVLQN
jgi:transposase